MASAGRRRNYKKTMIKSKLKQLLNSAVREITTGSLKNENLATKIRFLKEEKDINIAEAMNQTSDGSVGIILTQTDLKPWDDKIKELTTQRREEIAARLVVPDSEATAAAVRKKEKKARKKEREKTKKRMMSGVDPPGGWLPDGEGVEDDALERFTMKLKKDLESGGESKGGRRTRKRKRRRTKKRKSRKRKRRSKRRKN